MPLEGARRSEEAAEGPMTDSELSPTCKTQSAGL
jgi:hypothetical protein